MDVVEIQPDAATFRRVASALDDEADGREWRRDLATDLHAALAPGVAAARSAVLAMASGGIEHAGEPLRQAVAAGVVSEIRLNAGSARIRARKRGMPRGFRNAPKRLQERRGWRHPVFGSPDIWVTQRGRPGWFDDTLRRLRPQLRAAAEATLQSRATRIARRT